MKILKHGVYFSLVENRIVHCPKCNCIFGIESVEDIYYNDNFSYERLIISKSIHTVCPECDSDICLEREVKING